MRLLDASSRRRALTRRFRGELFPGRLTTGRFTGRLLGTCHDCKIESQFRVFREASRTRARARMYVCVGTLSYTQEGTERRQAARRRGGKEKEGEKEEERRNEQNDMKN